MDYGFTHQGRVYTPNGTPEIAPADNAERNAQIERAELDRWATRPDHQLAYFTFPADRAHSFTPTPGFPYRCDVCGSERGLSPELCDQSRVWRREYSPRLVGAHVTTWPGTRIGTVTHARVTTNNLGARIVSLRVRGSNGAEYYGRASWDNGNCVTLRRVKGGR